MKYDPKPEVQNESTLEIAPVQTEIDLSNIANLYQQANPHATLEEITKWTKKTWKNPDNIVLKAKLNEELVGAISIKIRKNKAIVDDMAIRLGYQNMNIGTKMWRFCEKMLKLRRISILTAHVHYKRAEVIPFSYRMGFRLNKVNRDGFGEGEDLIEVIKYI